MRARKILRVISAAFLGPFLPEFLLLAWFQRLPAEGDVPWGDRHRFWLGIGNLLAAAFVAAVGVGLLLLYKQSGLPGDGEIRDIYARVIGAPMLMYIVALGITGGYRCLTALVPKLAEDGAVVWRSAIVCVAAVAAILLVVGIATR